MEQQILTKPIINEEGMLVFHGTNMYLTEDDIRKIIDYVKINKLTSVEVIHNLLKIYEVYPYIIEKDEVIKDVLHHYRSHDQCKNITPYDVREIGEFLLIQIPHTNDNWCLERRQIKHRYNPFSGKTIDNKIPKDFLLRIKDECKEILTRIYKTKPQTRSRSRRIEYHSDSDSDSGVSKLSKAQPLSLLPKNISRRTNFIGDDNVCIRLSRKTMNFLDYWTELFTVGKTFVQIPFDVAYELVPTRPCKPIRVRRGMSWSTEDNPLFTLFKQNIKPDLTGHIVFTTFASFSHERTYAKSFANNVYYAVIETMIDFKDVIFDMDKVCNLGYKEKYAEAEVLVSPGRYKFTIIDHNLPGFKPRRGLQFVPTVKAIVETGDDDEKKRLIEKYMYSYNNNKNKMSLLVQNYEDLDLDTETLAHLVMYDKNNVVYIQPGDIDRVKRFIQDYSPKIFAEIFAKNFANNNSQNFPETLVGLKVVKKLGGSTGAKLVKDKNGKLFVLKNGVANPGHLLEEDTADRLYRVLGVPVPNSKIYAKNGEPPMKLAEFMHGKSLDEFLRSGIADQRDRTLQLLRSNFIVDALLGNWDVIGLDLDNILVDDEGVPWRIDNGGSLRYRAQGEFKKLEEWGREVTEIDTMRNVNINEAAANIFGGLTEKELNNQFNNIIKNKKFELLAAAPEELRDTLSARIMWLERRFPTPSVFSSWLPWNWWA